MIGILLAFVLSTNCTAYGFNDSQAVLLKCDDVQRSELVIPGNEWPKEWHGPQLGWTYRLDEKGRALSSFAEFAQQQAIRENVLREQRRWRRSALQQPIP